MSQAPPILYESHSHTTLCKHASGEPEEYAAAAEARGLKGIIFTCHCPLPDGISSSVRMAPEQFDLYVEMVERARQRFSGRIDVRLGLESDYLPGLESWLEKLHSRQSFHHILGSVHYHIPEYQKLFWKGVPFEFQQLYFKHLADSAETGLYDTIAHPDLVKNAQPEEWRLERILPDIQRALDRIAATGVAMELNTSGMNKSIAEFNPGPRILEEILQRRIPIVLGADAHVPQRVGDGYLTALKLLSDLGFTDIHIYLNRTREAVAIPDAIASLKS